MGNALKLVYSNSCKPSTTESESMGPHGVTAHAVSVSALAHDLLHFHVTSLVPEALSKHVVSSKKDQANWYAKLLEAWKEAKPPPRTPEDAARLIIQTLYRHQNPDVEGLLIFYGLPLPHASVELSNCLPSSVLPQGVKFELHTLPVDEKAVVDGDGMAVYVSTTDPRESSMVPSEVQVAAVQRSKSRAQRNYTQADALHKEIIDQNYRVRLLNRNPRTLLMWVTRGMELDGFDYRVMDVQNEEVLARKYWIRLRGIDAPESAMPYGQEAKEALAKLVRGKCLRVLVYGEDRYGRSIGDVYCNGIFLQEMMLKKGLAWHNKADNRTELAKWEKLARAKRVGLWASSNPEEPWNWRRDRGEGRN